jgi:uncharacterized protein (DUF1697 family)
VMPSGKNKVPMAQLRKVLEDGGFSNVRTYIQSGNAIVDSDLSASEIQVRIRKLIREHIGPDLVVIARTGAQLQKILDDNPFKSGHDNARVFFVLFAERLSKAKVAELLAQDFGTEKLVITNSAAYMFIPHTYGRGTLSNNYLEKKLGVAATMRNFNTLSKLAALGRA